MCHSQTSVSQNRNQDFDFFFFLNAQGIQKYFLSAKGIGELHEGLFINN